MFGARLRVNEDKGVLSQLAVEAKRRIEEIPGLVDAWSSSESGAWSSTSTREVATRYDFPLNCRPTKKLAVRTLAEWPRKARSLVLQMSLSQIPAAW
ncbi:MAG: hypothetical protein GY835_02935 [bacterium]|nr:hypothetical protein [bacterium]